MVVYVRENLAWARAVNPGVVLPVDVVDGLLSDDDGGVGSEADYALVQQVLVSSAVARLQGLQSGTIVGG